MLLNEAEQSPRAHYCWSEAPSDLHSPSVVLFSHMLHLISRFTLHIQFLVFMMACSLRYYCDSVACFLSYEFFHFHRLIASLAWPLCSTFLK